MWTHSHYSAYYKLNGGDGASLLYTAVAVACGLVLKDLLPWQLTHVNWELSSSPCGHLHGTAVPSSQYLGWLIRTIFQRTGSGRCCVIRHGLGSWHSVTPIIFSWSKKSQSLFRFKGKGHRPPNSQWEECQRICDHHSFSIFLIGKIRIIFTCSIAVEITPARWPMTCPWNGGKDS